MTALPDSPSGPSTRERLVDAAIDVFVDQGYESARVQDIARAAGMTTGAIYANYRGKAELLFDAIGARAGVELDALMHERTALGARQLLEQLGDRLPEPRDGKPALLLDAISAARRDAELAALLRARFDAREDTLSRLIDDGKRDGSIDASVDTDAFARFCTTLAMGALVVALARPGDPRTPELARVDRTPARLARTNEGDMNPWL